MKDILEEFFSCLHQHYTWATQSRNKPIDHCASETWVYERQETWIEASAIYVSWCWVSGRCPEKDFPIYPLQWVTFLSSVSHVVSLQGEKHRGRVHQRPMPTTWKQSKQPRTVPLKRIQWIISERTLKYSWGQIMQVSVEFGLKPSLMTSLAQQNRCNQ